MLCAPEDDAGLADSCPVLESIYVPVERAAEEELWPLVTELVVVPVGSRDELVVCVRVDEVDVRAGDCKSLEDVAELERSVCEDG